MLHLLHIALWIVVSIVVALLLDVPVVELVVLRLDVLCALLWLLWWSALWLLVVLVPHEVPVWLDLVVLLVIVLIPYIWHVVLLVLLILQVHVILLRHVSVSHRLLSLLHLVMFLLIGSSINNCILLSRNTRVVLRKRLRLHDVVV